MLLKLCENNIPKLHKITSSISFDVFSYFYLGSFITVMMHFLFCL